MRIFSFILNAQESTITFKIIQRGGTQFDLHFWNMALSTLNIYHSLITGLMKFIITNLDTTVVNPPLKPHQHAEIFYLKFQKALWELTLQPVSVTHGFRLPSLTYHILSCSYSSTELWAGSAPGLLSPAYVSAHPWLEIMSPLLLSIELILWNLSEYLLCMYPLLCYDLYQKAQDVNAQKCIEKTETDLEGKLGSLISTPKLQKNFWRTSEWNTTIWFVI